MNKPTLRLWPPQPRRRAVGCGRATLEGTEPTSRERLVSVLAKEANCYLTYNRRAMQNRLLKLLQAGELNGQRRGLGA